MRFTWETVCRLFDWAAARGNPVLSRVPLLPFPYPALAESCALVGTQRFRVGFAAGTGLCHTEKQLGLARRLLVNRVPWGLFNLFWFCLGFGVFLCFSLFVVLIFFLKFDFLEAWEVFLVFPLWGVAAPLWPCPDQIRDLNSGLREDPSSLTLLGNLHFFPEMSSLIFYSNLEIKRYLPLFKK